MMSTYFSVVNNKARLVFRRRPFWIVTGLLASFPVLIVIIMFLAKTPFSTGFAPPGLMTLALYFLVIPILIGPLILDDFKNIGEILWSSPLDGLAHFAGVFTGLWLGLLCGTLIQLGGWFLADLFWPNLASAWTWLFSLAVYLLTNTLGLCLTFLLAVLLRRILPLLVAWAGLWVWAFFSVAFSESLAESFYPMHSIAYINLFFHNLVLSPSLGLGLQKDLVSAMFTWFLGLSLTALTLTLLLTPLAESRWAARRRWIPPAALVIALLAAAAGYAVTGRAVAAHAVPASPLDVQLDVWKVLSQRTAVDVDASSGLLSGTSSLTLFPNKPPNQPEIVLRLNAGLALNAARDEAGNDLPALRPGDSLVIRLPGIPASPFTLNLSWKGTLHIPYTVYEQRWRHYDAPYPYGFTYMPLALQALVQPNGGYLLRDGDWMPWPWSSMPHQADENHLVIRCAGGTAVASGTGQGGAASWDGVLPEGLLVFLPAQKVQAGKTTIAGSQLASEQHMLMAGIFAAEAGRLAALAQEQPPGYVVVTPYLSDLVWSGNLLLIPDGSGLYRSKATEWLYHYDAAGREQPLISRSALFTLARAWLLGQLPPVPLEFQPVLSPAGGETRVVEIAPISEEDWIKYNGHWVQAAEFLDVLTNWDYRRQISLSPQGEWSTVAFWLAMELSDEAIRQADLDMIAYLVSQGKSLEHTSRYYELTSQRLWPGVLETERGRQIIQELHNWAVPIGLEEAPARLVAAVKENQPETVAQLMAELIQRSK